MIEQHREAHELGAYVLGGLSEDEAAAVLAHLEGCPDCRAELAELQLVADALGEVPEEFFLDGPPEDDLLVERAVREVRRQEAPASPDAVRRTPRRAWLAAAAVAGIVLLGGGVLAGRELADTPPPPQAQPTAPTPAPVPGTVTAEAADPETGSTMSVAVVPAAGWVRVNADVAGIPAGQRCRVIVVAADGTERVAGSWLVSPDGERDGTTLSTFALVAPEDVRAIRVESLSGRRFVNVRIA